MKLASYKDGSRDGQLVVVSRDLTTAHFANGIAGRLQQVLDDWNFLSPQLEDLSVALNHGRARHAFPFDPALCMAPLPRACHWAEGTEAGSACPLRFAPSDDLLGPTDLLHVASERMGLDFDARVVVVTGDLARGTPADQALDAVRLVALANAVALRELGAAHARPTTAFAPVAVTPDELGGAWQQGRVALAVHVQWNGKRWGVVDAGAGQPAPFGDLLADAARTRHVRAGSLVASGPLAAGDGTRGFARIADRRAAEAAEHGEARTGWLRFGDTVRLEVKGADGQPVFGAIDQAVATPE